MIALTGANPTSLYELYRIGCYRDGSVRKPICGKGTADKVKKSLKNGKLQLYEQYVKEASIRSPTLIATGEAIKYQSVQQIAHINDVQGLVKDSLIL